MSTFGSRFRPIPIPERIPALAPSKFVPVITPTTALFPLGIHKTTPVIPTMHLPPMQPPPVWLTPSMTGTPAVATRELPLDEAHTPVWPRQATLAPYSPFQGEGTYMQLFEPGTFPAEPWDTPVPIRLHPHLTYNPVDPNIPTLQWDIIHRPEQARVLTGRMIYRPADLKDPATSPGAPKIWIESDHPLLAEWMKSWGPIELEKGKGLTVRDVLDAIYEYFQQPLTQVDHDSITAHPEGSYMLTVAACERIQNSYENNYVSLKAGGFRRSDVMGNHRRFQGLRVIVYQNRSWKLFLGLQPGPVPRFQ